MHSRARITLSLCICACALLLVALALSSCGGGASSSSGASATESAKQSTTTAKEAAVASQEAALAQISVPSSLSPSTVVASVGDVKLTWAMLRHQMSIAPGGSHEVPEPPDFASCVSHASSSAPAGSSASVTSGSDSSSAKAQCEKTYRQLVAGALRPMIQAQWVLGEGKDRGLRVNQAELHKELTEVTQGASKQSFEASGLTLSDVRRNILAQQITNQLFADVKTRTPKVSSALVAAYYAAHKHQYAVPEERDVRIIRTASSLSALKALDQIKGGESFAEVVKNITLPQPIKTVEGTFHGLTHDYFSEPVLSDAIFKARPHVLSGPVKINLGYYVFEVIAVRAPHQASLRQAARSIRALLPEVLHTQVLTATVAAYRKKWTARTSCEAGFVVQGCSEFKASAATPAPDKYSF